MSRVKSVARGSRKKGSDQQARRGPASSPPKKLQRSAFLGQPFTRLFIPLSLAVITALPIVFRSKLWLACWRGNLSRAWDGTGHSSIAQIYDQSIFPDTFGWTNAYFAGMPFPNFYPPVFYWCVALLRHTHLVSFATAFKLVVVLPVLLIPVAMWLLGWSVSDKHRLVATAVALASALLLIDVRFMGALLAGLDYFSTFQIGLYTQPLGFILLIAWFIVYSSLGRRKRADDAPALTDRSRWRFVLSSLLLALTVLANFFNATTAVVLILATLICDAVCYKRGSEAEKRELRRASLEHCLSPVVALFLTLFWIVPLLNEYQYFVTRPYIAETKALFTPALIAWYAVAVIGGVLWLRALFRAEVDKDGDLSASRRVLCSYLGACTLLGGAVVFASLAAPRWFPLQTPRFLATLTFMLAVPVGYAVSAGFRRLAFLLDRSKPKNGQISFRRARYTTGLAIALFLLIALTTPDLSWAYAFYPAGKKNEIDAILNFARQHRDGRYLVEVINPKRGPAWTEASFDARAINSYLGAQGNETISGVFHEASPNVLFALPTVDAFSNYPDSFGISSVLADDLDFVAQPLEQHIARARFLGVKYLVIRTPAMKERLGKETGIAARHDFGWWSVYELRDKPSPFLEALSYKPALVVSSFTLKARRRNEMSFIRLAEEQFADNWFDVLLVRSPEAKIDRLARLNDFGALILDTYDYENETAAFDLLREYSQKHSLILLSSGANLCQRIKAAHEQFSKLQIIERSAEEPGQVLEAVAPSYHYEATADRQQWQAMRRILENNKEAINATTSLINGRVEQDAIAIEYGNGSQGQRLPVLVSTTFHPNWHRNDGEGIYASTPFYMLTFVDRSVRLHFERQRADKSALSISTAAAVLLGIYALWPFLRKFRKRSNRS
jgi:hypothetical protein